MQTMTRGTGTAKPDIEETVRPVEGGLKTGGGMASGNGHDLRARMQAAVDKAADVCQRLQAKTASAAKATDQAVRGHPYHAAGIAFGIGLLAGVLAMRFRHRE